MGEGMGWEEEGKGGEFIEGKKMKSE